MSRLTSSIEIVGDKSYEDQLEALYFILKGDGTLLRYKLKTMSPQEKLDLLRALHYLQESLIKW